MAWACPVRSVPPLSERPSYPHRAVLKRRWRHRRPPRGSFMSLFPPTAVPLPRNRDPLFEQAAEACIAAGSGSMSLLVDKLQVGYGRAAVLLDQLSEAGVLGPAKGSAPREVLVSSLHGNRDPLFEQAAQACIAAGSGSMSLLVGKLQVGYIRAAVLLDQLSEAGVLGPAKGSASREVLVSSLSDVGSQWPARDLPPPLDGELRAKVEAMPTPFTAPTGPLPSRSMLDRMRGTVRSDLLEPA